jgi:hypothetical protein
MPSVYHLEKFITGSRRNSSMTIVVLKLPDVKQKTEERPRSARIAKA